MRSELVPASSRACTNSVRLFNSQSLGLRAILGRIHQQQNPQVCRVYGIEIRGSYECFIVIVSTAGLPTGLMLMNPAYEV